MGKERKSGNWKILASSLFEEALDSNLTKEAIQGIATLYPVKCSCLDATFHENDQLKTNVVQTMESAKVQIRTL